MQRNFHIYQNKTKEPVAFHTRELTGSNTPPKFIRCDDVPFYHTGQVYKVTTREQAIQAYKLHLMIK